MKRHRFGVLFRLAVAPVFFVPAFAAAQGSDFERDELAKVEAANISYESKRYAEAANMYRQSMYTRKTRGLMFRYGMSLARSGQTDAAVEILRKVTQDNFLESSWDKGRDYKETSYMIAEAHFQLGLIYEKRKWWDLALSSYQDASSTGGSDWRAPFSAGYLLLSHWNNPVQALEYLNRALKRSPDSADIKNLIASCHNTIGVQRDQAGDEEGALAAFKEALQWRPGWDLAQKNVDVIEGRKAARVLQAALSRIREDEARREAEAIVRPPQPNLPIDLWLKFRELLFESTSPEGVAAMLKAEPRLALKRDYEEQTTLHLARTREIAQLLLDAGADPRIKNNRGGSSLFGAMTKDGPGVAMLLAKNGGDLFDRDNENRTLLHEAVSVFWGSTETIAWLLAQTQGGGGLVDKKDKNGITPLMLAPATWDQKVADLLLAYGADLSLKDAGGKTAAEHAAAVTDKPEIEAALRKLAEFGPKPRDYVVAAAERGDIEALRIVFAIAPGLVDSVDSDGRPLIAIAASAGADELLAFLLQSGARLGINGEMALFGAAKSAKLGAVRALIAAGVDVRSRNEQGYTMLDDLLAENADPDCVAAVIDAGADVDGVTRDGRVPLGIAAGMENVEMVRLLLKRGASAKVPEGVSSPLCSANAECATILIDAGADVNARDSFAPPLLYATARNDFDTVKLLVEHGADINAVDDMGRSPLHTLSIEITKLLVERGANPNIKDSEGKTPLDWAVEATLSRETYPEDAEEADKVIPLLTNAGAKRGSEL